MSDDPNPFHAKTSPLLWEAFALAWKQLDETKAWEVDGKAMTVARLEKALWSVAGVGRLDAATMAKRAIERYRTGLF